MSNENDFNTRNNTNIFSQWTVYAAISALAFSAYLLGVDGIAPHVTHLRMFASRDPQLRLLTVTTVRVSIELVAGLIALGLAKFRSITDYWFVFLLLLAIYNLFGVAEMLFYTGALDERHFLKLAIFGSPVAKNLIRAAILSAGIFAYIWFVSLTARISSKLAAPITCLLLTAFATPLVLIVLYFTTIPTLRFNYVEYVRFIVYYAGVNIGFLAFPKLRAMGQASTHILVTNNSRIWVAAGALGALLYIFQARL